MNEQNKIIGKRIKERRRALKMTQKELAQKIGCAEITVRQYESGRNAPKVDTRIALAKALDVPYVELFTPLQWNSPDDLKKVWDSIESDAPTKVKRHHADGTTTEEIHYRFEASDLSEREKAVFDSLYSLLRNKDDNTPK